MADGLTHGEQPEIIAEVGGLVDETRVTLALYGDTLEPSEVTKQLGLPPTTAHRKGDRKTSSSPQFKTGAWLLTVEGKARDGPGELITLLLNRFPNDKNFWNSLNNSYEVQIRVGIHTDGWNRGFELPASITARVASTGASLGFDLYFYGDEAEV